MGIVLDDTSSKDAAWKQLKKLDLVKRQWCPNKDLKVKEFEYSVYEITEGMILWASGYDAADLMVSGKEG